MKRCEFPLIHTLAWCWKMTALDLVLVLCHHSDAACLQKSSLKIYEQGEASLRNLRDSLHQPALEQRTDLQCSS